jgi:hypothetical protein
VSDGLSDHSQFEELCALATVGEISPAEYRKLSEHLRECAPCRDCYAGIRDLVHLDLPLAIPDEDLETNPSGIFSWFVEKQLKGRFVVRAKERGLDVGGAREARNIFWNWMPTPSRWSLPYQQFMAVVIVVLLVALAALSYRTKTANTREDALTREVVRLSDQDVLLRQRLETFARTKTEVEAALSELQGNRGDLAIRVRELETISERDDTALQSLDQQLRSSNERASLAEGKLKDARERLSVTDQELARLRMSRAEGDASAAGRQLQIADLSRRVKEQDDLIEKQQKLLEVEADVRNLMAARNLHITDVFDVDGKGKKQRAFGRVFYTEGRSLIFYAFDLNPPKGVSDKHSFQAWGQLTDSSTSAVNLGIFYVDDPAEKRWILKFDNPEVLSRLSAVFVTTEPRGGMTRPTGTKLMYAYLGHEPNHP